MNIVKLLVRLVLAGIGYVFGMALMGGLAPSLHLPAFKVVAGVSPQHMFLLELISSPLLIIGLLPLARWLGGSWASRWAAIAVLMYVTLGLNTLIEAKVFSSVLDGSPWLASLEWILPCVLAAGVITFRFGEKSRTAPAIGKFGAGGWLWRLGVAWLAFPMIYFAFGMMVAPIVLQYYQAGGPMGLRIPTPDVIVQTQLLRSAIFLAASFPALLLWTKSRGALILALGLAHAMTVGLFQLAQTSFLPMTMRIAHSVEITLDSFAYAAVLGLLFLRAVKKQEPVMQRAAAAD